MMFRRLVSLAVVFICVESNGDPLRAALMGRLGSDGQQPTARTSAAGISGTVARDTGATLADVQLQLRSIDRDTVVGRTVSGRNGEYFFPVSEPGLYVVEAVDGNRVRAVSQPVTVTDSPVTANVILSRGRAAAFFGSAAFPVLAAGAAASICVWAGCRGEGGPAPGPTPPVSPER